LRCIVPHSPRGFPSLDAASERFGRRSHQHTHVVEHEGPRQAHGRRVADAAIPGPGNSVANIRRKVKTRISARVKRESKSKRGNIRQSGGDGHTSTAG
jgi:hypothetical protein